MKVLLTVGHGIVFMRSGRTKDENGKIAFANYPVFKGQPEKHALALIKSHGNANALALVEKILAPDVYWTLVRRRILNINNKKKLNESKS